MSAECNVCGTDLVYGEWPEMFCKPCRLRKQRDTLLAALRKWFHDDGSPRYNSLDTTDWIYTDWIYAMAPDIRAAIAEIEGRE